MGPAASLTALVVLVLWSFPANAQSNALRPPDRFAAAVAKETVRLGSVGSSQAIDDARREAGRTSDPGWSKVRDVVPGTELKIETRASRVTTRYFLQADENGMIVVNLDDAPLDGSAKHALVRLAQTDPKTLLAVLRGGTAKYGDVRVTPNGVFVGDERESYLPPVLQTMARTDVVEIKVPPTGHATRNGALIGLAAGEALAAVGALSCGSGCGDEGGRGPAFGLLSIFFGGPGAGIGAGVGALIGAMEPTPVIYHALEK